MPRLSALERSNVSQRRKKKTKHTQTHTVASDCVVTSPAKVLVYTSLTRHSHVKAHRKHRDRSSFSFFHVFIFSFIYFFHCSQMCWQHGQRFEAAMFLCSWEQNANCVSLRKVKYSDLRRISVAGRFSVVIFNFPPEVSTLVLARDMSGADSLQRRAKRRLFCFFFFTQSHCR